MQFPAQTLPDRYIFRNEIAAGGFGAVGAAYDTRRVLQHKYTSDGQRTLFKVTFKHMTLDDSGRVKATVGGQPVPCRLVQNPPGCGWPLYVEFPTAPPAGADVLIETNELVAVKYIKSAFGDSSHAKCAVREVRLMRFFAHENILGLHEIYGLPSPVWQDMILVMELMDNSLRAVVKGPDVITEEHASYFTWQILQGVKALHAADIIHRDLKTHNVLVDSDCRIKICDFGMARMEDRTQDMTDEVATIWYRPPELLCDCPAYSKPIDMWAVGTILGELISRKAMFMGRHALQMLDLITGFLGSPSPSDLDHIQASKEARRHLSAARRRPVDLRAWCPTASSHALDLLSKLLTFDPDRRLSAEEALRHPFCRIWRGGEDEPEGEEGDLEGEEDDLEPLDRDPSAGEFVRLISADPSMLPRTDGQQFDDSFESAFRTLGERAAIDYGRKLIAEEIESLQRTKRLVAMERLARAANAALAAAASNPQTPVTPAPVEVIQLDGNETGPVAPVSGAPGTGWVLVEQA
eukprot:TRINITY_DN21554_c0_g1_i1.p1 TRINITY_DN21554_c0_g1~~TRINITY_DN21554_c0_g1_i1.p1  ORF type:complete len:522 (-),score=97.58 TRINITY_DN21554_c0_g1_i1:75-1640(-)